MYIYVKLQLNRVNSQSISFYLTNLMTEYFLFSILSYFKITYKMYLKK